MSEPACPSLPQPGQDRTLHDAIDEFRRVLSANVALAGAEDHLDRSEQFQAIEATARRLGSPLNWPITAARVPAGGGVARA
jgi:hypothetical protein